jgi:hypothetical protein
MQIASGNMKLASAVLPDKQFPHTSHAQTARRANLPHAFMLAPSGKSQRCSRASRLDEEGRFGRSSRYVGRGCDGRVSAQDVARGTRSTKPCGPDTPMLVSTLRAQEPGGTVTRTPGTPRRARNKSSNIARGMPDVSGCTCDHSCAFSCYFCTRDRGCNGARHSLRPLSI